MKSSEAVLTQAGLAVGLGEDHEISLLLCDGPTIHRLNRRWRGIDRPTDVLSFPANEVKPGQMPPPGPMGDIALALPIARRQARELVLEWRSHLEHLLIHGLLHLMGYDHMEEKDALEMEREEQRLMREIRE